MTPQSLLLPCRRATKLASGTTGSCARLSTGTRSRQGLHGASASSTSRTPTVTSPTTESMIMSTTNSNGNKASKHQKVHNLTAPAAAAPWIKVNERNLSAPSNLYAQFNQKGGEQTKANDIAPQGTIGVHDEPNSLKTDAIPSKVYSHLIKPRIKVNKNKNKKNHKAMDQTKKNEFLVPGAPLATPYYYFKRVLWKRTLPTLNISSLFDAVSREDLLQVLRDEVPKHTRTPFFVTGHAVPTQLLQDHLQFADSILSQHEGQECSFNNFQGDATFDDWIRIRGRDGINRSSRIPDELQHSMDLYLTVMNRLATNLALGFLEEPRKISRWNVELLRDWVYPEQCLPQDGPLALMVEWVPRSGIAAPGHVILHLQGYVRCQEPRSRRTRTAQVTLVFDACFRTKINTMLAEK